MIRFEDQISECSISLVKNSKLELKRRSLKKNSKDDPEKNKEEGAFAVSVTYE